MELEIKLNNRTANVRLIKNENSQYKFLVDDNEYLIDIEKVGNGVYSIIYKGKSYNVELVEDNHPKKYIVNTYRDSYNTEIIDAETRYLMNKKGDTQMNGDSIISTPMPGKIVKVLVEKGQEIKKGEPVIIVSAMKMESEYKSGKAGVIAKIHVNEGDTVNPNQPLITID